MLPYLMRPFFISLPLRYRSTVNIQITKPRDHTTRPLTSNLTATADLNPINMGSSRPSKPAYRFSNACLTENPHFPFTLNVISAPRSSSEIGSFLGFSYRRCGMQPPY